MVNLGLVLLHKPFLHLYDKNSPILSSRFCKIRELILLKILTYKQKKIMKQKRQLIDHWVASRGPFLRFLFHFRDKSFFMTTGATLVRYEQPSEGSASPLCSSSSQLS